MSDQMASQKRSVSHKIPTGMAVDPTGGPVIDPTANVIALTEAANRRQDDLRDLTNTLNELRISCQKEIGDLRAGHVREVGEIRTQHLREMSMTRETHQEKLRIAEAQRLDAIRQVDREDVNKTATQVLSAVQTLAQTNNTTAETLRNQVATTAAANASAFQTAMQEVNKRLSALELSSSAGLGGTQGMRQMWSVLIAIIMFIVAVTAVVVGFNR